MALTYADPSLAASESLDQDPAHSGAEIIQFPLNQELALGEYNDKKLFALGKTAIKANRGVGHWLGIVRLGGYHLIFTDLQKIGGYYTDAIAKQLALANEMTEANPGFATLLGDDIAQTGQAMSGGYILPDRSVVDYVWLDSQRRFWHPDSKNEHVDPLVRNHTVQVAKVILRDY